MYLVASGMLRFGLRKELEESGILTTFGTRPPLESGIRNIESRIQDCLGLPYKTQILWFQGRSKIIKILKHLADRIQNVFAFGSQCN